MGTNPDDVSTEGLAAIAEDLGIPKSERHIFLCCDQTKPKCCAKEDGLASWEFLKQRLDDLGLAKGPGRILFRTTANCLKVCEDGPIAVVYPEGIWYHYVDNADIDEIIDSHLVKGVPVERLKI